MAATGFAQPRRGGGSAVGARSFAGGAVRGGFAGAGRGFVTPYRGFAGIGPAYARRYYGGYGFGYGLGLGYPAAYAPYCYDSYYYGAYGCGLPPYGYYRAPVAPLVVPRAVIAPRAAVIAGGGWRHFGPR